MNVELGLKKQFKFNLFPSKKKKNVVNDTILNINLNLFINYGNQ